MNRNLLSKYIVRFRLHRSDTLSVAVQKSGDTLAAPLPSASKHLFLVGLVGSICPSPRLCPSWAGWLSVLPRSQKQGQAEAHRGPDNRSWLLRCAALPGTWELGVRAALGIRL